MFGARGRTRTCDRLITNQQLSPLSYSGLERVAGADLRLAVCDSASTHLRLGASACAFTLKDGGWCGRHHSAGTESNRAMPRSPPPLCHFAFCGQPPFLRAPRIAGATRHAPATTPMLSLLNGWLARNRSAGSDSDPRLMPKQSSSAREVDVG